MPGCLPVCRCRGHRGQAQSLHSVNGGRASARSTGSIGDRVEGTGRPDLLPGPGVRSARGISGHGARRRRADADRAGFRPGGSDVHLVLGCGDDEHDAMGERSRPGGSRCLAAGKVRNSFYARSPPGAYAATRITRTSLPADRTRERCRAADLRAGPAAAVLAAGASRAGPRRGVCLPPQDRGGRPGEVSPPPGASRPAPGASPA